MLLGGLLGAVGLVLAGPAWAHSALTGTDPATDTTVPSPPTEIVLTFSEVVFADYSTVVVTDANGAQMTTGEPTVVDTRLTVPVSGLAAGTYQVAWRVVSTDGHPVSGQFGFTVEGAARNAPAISAAGTAPPEASPPEASPPETDESDPTTASTTEASAAPEAGGSDEGDGGPLPWIVGVAAGLVVGGAAVLFLRRSRERQK